MKINTKNKIMLKLGTMFLGLMLLSTQVNALTTKNLCTGTFVKTMPGGELVTMWGFGDDTTPGALGICNATVPGPELTLPAGETVLTINVRNTLSDSVSVMIPGLSTTAAVVPVRIAGRVRSFTHETAAATATTDGTASYSFKAKAGTYLYQSGTHIAKQMQMGLYGAVLQNTSDVVGALTLYPGVPYSQSVTQLYSEIDPALHTAVAAGTYGSTGTMTSTINYSPKYFLINGEPYTPATAKVNGGSAGSTLLLRFLNAGLETHVPMVNGQYVNVVAEYGNQYPYPRSQYSVMLPAGQTRDVVMTAPIGDYAIFDRRLRLTNSNQAGIGGLFSIISIAAPVVALNAATPAKAAGTEPGSGGCSLRIRSEFDPLLPLLMLLSFVYFIRRLKLK